MENSMRCLALLVIGLCTIDARCHALTTTYSFSSPDNVFVTVSPGSFAAASWPTQLLNSRTATESNAGIVFRNEVNNTIFVDTNALQVGNATVFDGTYVWADVQYNGPSDEPYIEIDFSNWIGGAVQELQFDFALTLDLPASGTIVFDSEGDQTTLFSSTSSFTFGGGQTGSQGSASLIAGGAIDDIAKVRFEFADENFAGLQIGFDNFVIIGGDATADFTGDHVVDAADLVLWQTTYGDTAVADADQDGDSDGQDFLIWQNEFIASPLTVAVATVPESATLLSQISGLAILSSAGRRFR